MKAVLERNLGFLGYPYYSVDTDGNVISHKRDGLFIKPQKCYKYERVGLVNEEGMRLYRVHQLVALAFIPNPNNYKQINHIDGNPHNNKVSNLEWCSAAHNIRHTSYKYKGGKNKPKALICRKVDGTYVGQYKSGNEAALELGIYANSIYLVAKGVMASTHGYVFEYVDKDLIEIIQHLDSNNNVIKEYKNEKEAAIDIGKHKSNIYRYIRGVQKPLDGSIWVKIKRKKTFKE